MKKEKTKKKHGVSYAKWGYIFILPFFAVYLVWSFIPQILTFIYSFFEMYKNGLTQIGPNFVGLDNYIKLFKTTIDGVPTVIKYAGNTMFMWIIGVIPQFLIALLLAAWLTSYRLNIKGQAFFKTVIYLPNLIMASAFSMMIWTVFSTTGPVHKLLEQMQMIDGEFDFFYNVKWAYALVALINFLMWFGNTTIVLMAGIMGIDQSLFEAAMIDGANSIKVFFKVTLPLLMPILTYAVITSLLGGINMYDVPYIISAGKGTPNNSTMTLIMYVSRKISGAQNYGEAGALSVLVFIFSGVISLLVYRYLVSKDGNRESYKSKGGRRK